MTFGEDWGFGAPPEESTRVIDAYLDLGGNFFDTANMYTKGASETILGERFRDPAARDRVVIATKFGGNMFPADPNGGGASRKAVLRQCEDSLRRLKTDYIDLYWLHFQDPHTPIDETVLAVDTLIRQGKVRYFGISDTPAWKVTQAIYEARLAGAHRPIALQIEYSLVERTVEADLIPMARAMGLGVTPWSPLKYGILSGKYRRSDKPPAADASTPKAGRVPWTSPHLSERTYAIIDALERAAADVGNGCTIAQAALAWLRVRPGVTSTIIGARTADQLRANMAALSITLPPAHIAALDAASAPTLPFPHEFLTRTITQVHGAAQISINGVTPAASEILPRSDAERR
jgi:aryl-alcohol dehydrogenase-like predicted oxidoreductase